MGSPLMRCLAIAALVAAVSMPATDAAAAIYRWVDQDGTVHYSDQPRAGAEKVGVEQRRSRSTSGNRDSADGAGQSRTERAATIRAEECGKAKERLASFREAATLTTTGEDGEPRPLTAEERVQAIARAEEDVAGLCGSDE